MPASSLRSSVSALTALLIPALPLGCGSDSSTAAEEPQATAIVVTAEDFLDGAQCIDAPGTLHAWGVNLEHVAHPAPLPGTPPPAVEAPFVNHSSGLVRCVQGLAFGNVELGGTYKATICGYQDPALATGELLDDVCNPGNGLVPDWTFTCGEVVVEYQALRHVRDCKLVGEPPPETETVVTVGLDPASCASAGGELESFRVFRDGEPLSDEPIPCGERWTIEDAIGGDSYDLELLAYLADEEDAALGTVCHARAITGATVAAACDPLQSEGGIEVRLDAALGALGLTCPATVGELSLSLDTGEMLEVPAASCSGSVRFGGVAPGERELTVTAVQGGESSSATCTATVEPGLVTSPRCDSE